jgi:arylsulfatase A-like enzyme
MVIIKKWLPNFLVISGITAIIIAYGADLLNFGDKQGFGIRQTILTICGILLVLFGLSLKSKVGSRLINSVLGVSYKVNINQIPPPTKHLQSILLLATWFGLVAGLIEGIVMLLMQYLSSPGGDLYYFGGSLQIIWISALFNGAFYLLIGVFLYILKRIIPHLPIHLTAFFIFSVLMIFDMLYLLLYTKIAIYALLLIAVGVSAEMARKVRLYEQAVFAIIYGTFPRVAIISIMAVFVIQSGYALGERLTTNLLYQADPNAPNIILLVIDTLRVDHVSCYGYYRQTTSNIDHLAQKGILFENAISTSSWTYPAHFSLLTGQISVQNWPKINKPASPVISLAEVLRNQGYRTGAFSGNYYIFNRISGFGKGFIHFEDHYRSFWNGVTGTIYGHLIESWVLHGLFGIQGKLGRYQAEHITDALLNWVAQGNDRPFFAFVNYYDPHDPYLPPQPFRSKFATSNNPGGLFNSDWDNAHMYLSLTPQQLQDEIDAYDGAIAYVDQEIGRLVNTLLQNGQLENTILIIVSDHGEMFGEHGLFNHGGSLHRELIHVPLIISWPGLLPENVRVAHPISIAALPATLLEMIGKDHQSFSFYPSLAPYWQYANPQYNGQLPLAGVDKLNWAPPQHLTSKGAMVSVVNGHWHYVLHEIFGEELFDWNNDLDESIDLIAEPELQDVLSTFRQLFNWYPTNK